MHPPTPTGVSRTAVLIAQARAREGRRRDRMFIDQYAGPLAAAAGWIGNLSRAGMLVEDHFVLRTRYFDDYLTAALDDGIRQVVLLAAGLDSRAYRMLWPDGTKVFEVDLPDLLSFKNEVLAKRGAVPSCERVPVPADLREDWPDALRDAGFDPDLPTAWLVEGLMVYLTEADNDLLLARIGALSGTGSRLAIEHVNQAYSEHPRMKPAHNRLAATAASWQSSVEDPVAWLAGHGWRGRITGQAEIAKRNGRDIPPIADVAVMGDARLWLVDAVQEGADR
ncbi:SAM-dependent methyltransferase [Actinoplanes flavus]|uniref:S-adenosyl-L-methionine-dependent methyltransferase n=1 Tax=Actinoplanes flavus TaxID=2820290 RepID=A0ABS3UAX4_9ACTN|nr:SAM-dependent methyltransferase [Actinoplanes flavus]MBO3735930.1 SAM-dependent methyltransferase [Actinoplanes flavus]